MVGWHHWINGHEFEQALGDNGGRGGLVCCSPGDRKESNTTYRMNNTKNVDVWLKPTQYCKAIILQLEKIKTVIASHTNLLSWGSIQTKFD